MNFKKFTAPGHLCSRPWLGAATLNQNIKNNGFALQNSGQNQGAESNSLFLFLICMRVLICMALTKFSRSSFMQLEITRHLCAWGNQTSEASESEIKGVWGEKKKTSKVSC